jgi:hypothetical protein
MAVDEPSGGGEDASRQAGGLLLRELLKESSDVFNTYASQVRGDSSMCVQCDGGHPYLAGVAASTAMLQSRVCEITPQFVASRINTVVAARASLPQAGGLLLRELLKKSSYVFNIYASQVRQVVSVHTLWDGGKRFTADVFGKYVMRLSGRR